MLTVDLSPKLLKEGKSVFSNSVSLGISTTSGQALCSGVLIQYIIELHIFINVHMYFYLITVFFVFFFNVVLFCFLGLGGFVVVLVFVCFFVSFLRT